MILKIIIFRARSSVRPKAPPHGSSGCSPPWYQMQSPVLVKARVTFHKTSTSSTHRSGKHARRKACASFRHRAERHLIPSPHSSSLHQTQEGRTLRNSQMVYRLRQYFHKTYGSIPRSEKAPEEMASQSNILHRKSIPWP